MRRSASRIAAGPLVGGLLFLAGCDGSSLEPVAAPIPIVAVTTGADHSCGLSSEGRAYCWGRGYQGELGNGRAGTAPTPEAVATDLRFSTISAGEAHTCALTVTGEAYCWGWNPFFQRGNAVDTATARPVPVAGGHRFTSLDAGGHHTCALDQQGAAWCWGYNRFGQLGDGSTSTPGEPVRVAGGLRFVQISAGGQHTCGLTTAPSGPNAQCWGLNTVGQTGTGGTDLLLMVPTPVAGGVRLERISAGRDHTCGVTPVGDLYCWGGNAHGQLGIGGAFPDGLPGGSSPLQSPSPVRFQFVSAGIMATCGIAADGRAYCWGRGDSGQLGVGSTLDHYHPQGVLFQPSGTHTELLTFRTLSPGRGHTCGSTREDVIFCWGTGPDGQLGRPGPVSSLLPLRVDNMR